MTDLQIDPDVRVEVTVNAPIERTFHYFTERVDSWWPREHHLSDGDGFEVRMESWVGGRWYERSADGKECVWGRVLVWEPPTHVVLSWQLGVHFEAQDDPELASRIDVRFESDGPDRTTISFVHSEFEKHGAGWENLRRGVGAENGWRDILKTFAEATGS